MTTGITGKAITGAGSGLGAAACHWPETAPSWCWARAGLTVSRRLQANFSSATAAPCVWT